MPGVTFWRRAAHEGNGRAHRTPSAAMALAPSADLPYLRGRAEFDSVFADLARGKRNWQLVAFGALAVAGVLAGGLVTLATQTRITPYVVEVDRLGRAQAFGPAERLRATDQRVIMSQLAGFVRDTRTVLADPVAQAELVRHSYAFVDQNAAAFLNGYFAAPAHDPRLVAKDATRLVEVTSVLPVPGSTTWKVSWTETTVPRTTAGAPSAASWEGYFGTRIVAPATTERITVNPLGLYVTSVNWTQLATRVQSAPAAPTASTPGTPPQPSSSPPPSQE